MFADALATAQQFTRPVVGSFRRFDAKVAAASGTFIIINEDGWILTVAHLFQPAQKHASDQLRVAALNGEIAAIEADASLTTQRRNK